MKVRTVTLLIKSHPQNLALIGLAARVYCREFLCEDFAEEVELAIVESLNNVIEHSYLGESSHNIEVVFEFPENAMVCKIRDFGAHWELQPEYVAPDLDVPVEDLPEGGFGLYLVHQVMDSVTLEKKDPGSLLVLKKYVVPVAVGGDGIDDQIQ